jgi:hypothetical protein
MLKLGAIGTGWMDIWELNPEGLGSLWLIAFAICGEDFVGIILVEGFHDWSRQAVPRLNYTLAWKTCHSYSFCNIIFISILVIYLHTCKLPH